MINVIVSYKVKPEFVTENKENIQKFLENFKSRTDLNFDYKVLYEASENKFTHISEYENEEIQQEVLKIPIFLEFQKARDEKGLVEPPMVPVLEKLGSNR